MGSFIYVYMYVYFCFENMIVDIVSSGESDVEFNSTCILVINFSMNVNSSKRNRKEKGE